MTKDERKQVYEIAAALVRSAERVVRLLDEGTPRKPMAPAVCAVPARRLQLLRRTA